MITYDNLSKVKENKQIPTENINDSKAKEVLKVGKYRIELNDDQHPLMVVEEKIAFEELRLNDPNKVVGLVNTGFNLNKLAEEHIYLIAVNTQYKPLGVFEVAHGQINQCGISPREIFLRALICGATGIFIVHNHPSGQVKPSKADFQICKRIKESGALLGVTLYDFLIVAEKDSYSFLKNKDM